MSLFRHIVLLFVMLIGVSTYAQNNNKDALGLYNKLKLESSVSFKVFKKAYELNKQNKSSAGIYTVIDFSKPSNVKRLVIIDSNRETLLMREYVAHGKNSGGLKANSFSNTVNSLQTSLGIYKTAETYYGKYGYSLKLDGLSKSNSNARKRYIVMHPAKYASRSFLKKHGYIGRSFGCPSVDPSISKKMINLIKGGSYIYAFT